MYVWNLGMFIVWLKEPDGDVIANKEVLITREMIKEEEALEKEGEKKEEQLRQEHDKVNIQSINMAAIFFLLWQWSAFKKALIYWLWYTKKTNILHVHYSLDFAFSSTLPLFFCFVVPYGQAFMFGRFFIKSACLKPGRKLIILTLNNYYAIRVQYSVKRGTT